MWWCYAVTQVARTYNLVVLYGSQLKYLLGSYGERELPEDYTQNKVIKISEKMAIWISDIGSAVR